MTIKEKLNCLEEVLDIEENTLHEDMILSEMSEWDSMASISLVAMLDDTFDKILTFDQVKNFKNVRDILNEME